MKDSENPNYLFTGIDTVLLSQIIDGDIDAVYLAKKELAKRGLNNEGVWIGFEKAKELNKKPIL